MPESVEQAFPDLPHIQLADMLAAGEPPGQGQEPPLAREPIAAERADKGEACHGAAGRTGG